LPPNFGHEWIHPKDIALVRHEIDLALGTEEHEPVFICRLKHLSGHWITVLNQGYWIRDPSGQLQQLVGTLTPIQNRTLTSLGLQIPAVRDVPGLSKEEELISASRVTMNEDFFRLQLALKNSGLGTFDWDLNTQKILWDPQHEALWGLPPGTFSGDLAGFLKGVHPEDAPQVTRDLEEAQARKHSFVGEFRVIWPDGSLHWIQSCGEFTFDPVGKAQRMVGTVADITERKNALRQLKESETHFRALFEHLPIAYQSLDEDGRWLDVNDAMAQLLGYPRGDAMIGNRFSDHLENGLSLQFQSEFEAFKKTHHIEREVPLIRCDGKPLEALISARIQRDDQGRFVRAHCIVLDVTERREMLRASEARKEALEHMVSQRTAELQEALTMRSRFLAHMSHEIRNPMNIIGVNTHLLERTPLSDMQKGMVSRTRRASDVMLSLLNEVLDYSKLEAGEISLEIAPFSLKELLNGILLLQGAAAEAKQLELEPSDTETLPDEWMGDKRRIEQVLINLTSNAIKFTDTGRISVKASLNHRTNQCCELYFEVNDTGRGIPADQIPALFQPFKQTHPHSAAPIVGTGLGLSISKGLVELMGGTIGVHSTPGLGSCFWFTLPLRCAVSQMADPSKGSDLGQEKLRDCRLLLVDDDPEHLKTLTSLLESEGAICTSATNGLEGLELIAKEPQNFHAVLMDIQMPVMDGIKATSHVRQQMKLNQLPIIAVTGGLSPEQQQQAMESGITHLLKKPIDPEELMTVLSKYCQNQNPS
jgi:two-component system sensor histidine kinase/response regulator